MHNGARAAIALVICAVLVPMAAAHRLDLLVSADGAVIHGTATYTPGGPVTRGTVEFQAPDGSKLGETGMQSDGSFSFQTPVRCDITVILDTPDAHRATALLPAAELPQALPAWDGAATDRQGDADAVLAGPADDLLPIIERAVSRQIAPLRQEIAALEASVRLRDILGGLGYIAGLAGLLLYFKTRRAKAP